MKIHYLGTGAAEGIPAMFCNCEYCKAVRRRGGKEVRSRAQVILDDELSIDFPPDAFCHGAAFGADLSAVKYLLVTHSHMDHFYAHDFVLRGYKYATEMTSPTLDIYCNAECAEVFAESTRREMREEIASTLHIHPLTAFQEVRFGGWRVLPLKAQHTSRDPLLFFLEKDGKRILHLHDTGAIPEEDFAALERAAGGALDLVTLDCTFLWEEVGRNARHMGLTGVDAVLSRLEKIGLVDAYTKRVITHFSHNSRPTPERIVSAEEQFGVLAAFDGMILEI